MKFILTGTTGNLGSRVLTSLINLDLIPTSDLVISSSSPDKVPKIARDKDISIVHGDFTDSKSMSSTFKNSGADALFLVSYPSPSVKRWEHHKRVIDAAQSSGAIKLIIYTSLMFGGRTGMASVAGVQQAHIKTIEYLQSCGLDYTVLREGIYAESWWLYAGFQPHPLPKGDTSELDFVIPNDGPVAWVAWDDLGEGTARILGTIHKGGKEYYGKTLNLTGPKAISISELAKLVEKYSGRQVNLKIVGSEEARRYHTSPNLDNWVVESWSGWHEGLAAGETAVVDPLLENLLGRRPRGMEEMAEQLFTPV